MESLERSSRLMSAARSILLVVDMQERLLPAIAGGDGVTAGVRFLMESAELLNVPIVVSEQYPKGLGPTVSALPCEKCRTETFDKLRFSAAEGLREILGRRTEVRDQFIVCGIEAHVCVLQTALDLRSEGDCVFVVADAVGSRQTGDCETALRRLRDEGCVVTTAESVAFEWCEAAGSDTFRAVSRLVRARATEGER